MFEKILVANRGEIAVRIVRACKDMGIATVAIHSEADADSLHVRMADERVCVGPAATKDSYLNTSNIISAALITECEAVHPGVGMLAENAHFAEACQQCGLKFIGPSSDVMVKLGNKAAAKEIMEKAGIRAIPGTGHIDNEQTALRFAREVGYPVMIKAAGGGGGRGIRIVHDEGGMADALQVAQSEAKAGFGDPAVYVEKYLDEPRHVEIQILADEHENVIHLGDRDCSIQYGWHQKLLEESPSPGLEGKDGLRGRLGEAAIKAAKTVGYENAGTVEFLLDKKGRFHFMEMNTRLQVEHPVTEEVTGMDLVAEQIKIALGEKLSVRQRDVRFNGVAIECRIDARNPDNKLMPSGGVVQSLTLPGGPGVRIDTHLYTGYHIPNHYDALLAKVICHGADRDQAIRRMERALSELEIIGVPTTRSLHLRILGNAFYRRGEFFTNFLRRRMGL